MNNKCVLIDTPNKYGISWLKTKAVTSHSTPKLKTSIASLLEWTESTNQSF
jgi:hypothetical protein